MFANQYLNIALSSLAVYVFIIIAIRISGRKELTQLSVIDLVFILLISNAVQNAMVGPSTSLSGGLVAASTLFAANFILKELIFRFAKVGKIIQGQELMLVYEGVLNKNNLRKAKISRDELDEAIREHGVEDLADVNLAVLEVDGNISVMSNNYQSKTVKKYKAHKTINKNM